MDIFSVLVGVGTTALVKGEIAKFLSTVFATTPEMIAETINNEFQLFNKKRTYETLIKICLDLKNKGVEPNQVTKKVLVPLLRNLDLEDEDENLYDKWSNLLKKAISGVVIHPSIIKMLEQFSPIDARVLDTIAQEFLEKGHPPTGNEIYAKLVLVDKEINKEAVNISIGYLINFGLCIQADLITIGVSLEYNGIKIGLTRQGAFFLDVVYQDESSQCGVNCNA